MKQAPKNKTTLWATILLLFIHSVVNACPVCEKQQPKLLRGITHGAGPQSNWDWLIVGIMTLITLLVLVYTIRFLIKPGEQQTQHIKHQILH